jgi:uncharacterized protein YndB with AHSA1/START domain
LAPAPDGRDYVYEAIYRDIVPTERIVYTYDIKIDDVRFSVSVVTVEFSPGAAAPDGAERVSRRARGAGEPGTGLGRPARDARPRAIRLTYSYMDI